MTRPHDPGADPEGEGMPDLQDGTPQQQEANDPQRLPVAGDEPTVAEERDTTVDEVIEDRSLDDRLADETPDIGPESGDGPPAPPAGLLYDEPDPDLPRNQDVFAQEGSVSGLSAEEDAVRVEDDEEFGVGDDLVIDDVEADQLAFDQEPVDELVLQDDEDEGA
ncbi:hypothetical protein ABZY90_35420 [Streptomyces sp. NPDC006422]|uniref:hypothetical protein n=1 Tax=unclassified Streptomyces TaxID=2593676 RepID=UPI0033A09B21